MSEVKFLASTVPDSSDKETCYLVAILELVTRMQKECGTTASVRVMTYLNTRLNDELI
jgi:hypothetical protein